MKGDAIGIVVIVGAVVSGPNQINQIPLIELPVNILKAGQLGRLSKIKIGIILNQCQFVLPIDQIC